MNKKTWKKLKILRKTVAYGLLFLLVLAMWDPDLCPPILNILPKLQFGQLMAGLISGGNTPLVAVLLITILVTIALGRWFCSFICPLGATMDLLIMIRSHLKSQKFNFIKDSPISYLIPAIAFILLWVGITLPYNLLEPYSLMVSLSPFYKGSGILLFIILLAAPFSGRSFCNYLCPTGLILRLLSYSPFFRINIKNSCLDCGSCAKKCPASAIDLNTHKLSANRCILCLECLSVCPNKTLQYGATPEKNSAGRRSFIRTAGAMAIAGSAFMTPQDLRAKMIPNRQEYPILPPGALSLAHLNAHCTLCHTCLRVCPNQALVPSHNLSSDLFDKPVLDPQIGFCQYDCIRCTEVCPTGALYHLTREAKHLNRLGMVHFYRPDCVVITKGTSCGACGEICPTGAIIMAQGDSGLDEPFLRTEFCIGCGACQRVCPVRPKTAVYVSGLTIQETASAPKILETEDLKLGESFPF